MSRPGDRNGRGPFRKSRLMIIQHLIDNQHKRTTKFDYSRQLLNNSTKLKTYQTVQFQQQVLELGISKRKVYRLSADIAKKPFAGMTWLRKPLTGREDISKHPLFGIFR